VGLFAMASARMLGADRVIAIDRFDYRLDKAREAGATDLIDYEQVEVPVVLKEMTGRPAPRCLHRLRGAGGTSRASGRLRV
jgi:threonine dehydrogenase-like Zn-dependent dehydrogenase